MPSTRSRRARRKVEHAEAEDVALFALMSGLTLPDAEASLARTRHDTAMAKLRAKGWRG